MFSKFTWQWLTKKSFCDKIKDRKWWYDLNFWISMEPAVTQNVSTGSSHHGSAGIRGWRYCTRGQIIRLAADSRVDANHWSRARGIEVWKWRAFVHSLDTYTPYPLHNILRLSREFHTSRTVALSPAFKHRRCKPLTRENQSGRALLYNSDTLVHVRVPRQLTNERLTQLIKWYSRHGSGCPVIWDTAPGFHT